MMDSIKLLSNRVIISESEENPDILTAKFVICDFSVTKTALRWTERPSTSGLAHL